MRGTFARSRGAHSPGHRDWISSPRSLLSCIGILRRNPAQRDVGRDREQRGEGKRYPPGSDTQESVKDMDQDAEDAEAGPGADVLGRDVMSNLVVERGSARIRSGRHIGPECGAWGRGQGIPALRSTLTR